MKPGLHLALTAARALGADEGTRDAAALAGRRSLARGNHFPEAPVVEGPITQEQFIAQGRALAFADLFNSFDMEESCFDFR